MCMQSFSEPADSAEMPEKYESPCLPSNWPPPLMSLQDFMGVTSGIGTGPMTMGRKGLPVQAPR